MFEFEFEVLATKFYIRRNNNKVDSIETRCIIIAHLLPYTDLHHAFLNNDGEILSSVLKVTLMQI